MEKLPLVGVYRKSASPRSEAGTKTPSSKGDDPCLSTERRKAASRHPPSLCILTLLDSKTSASLLERWRREGVRLHRASKAQEGGAGVWVRLLSGETESPAKCSLALPEEETQAPKEWGLVPSASPAHPQYAILGNDPPQARPCNGWGERVDCPAYVARLYRCSAEPGSVLSTYA